MKRKRIKPSRNDSNNDTIAGPQTVKEVRKDVLNSKLRSKEDMYRVLTGYCEYFVV
jgi:hypothetical protein